MAYRFEAAATLALALGAGALFLQGCGGGSVDHDAARAFDLVSQTFSGNITMTSSISGVPTPSIATMEFGLDMEAVRFYSNVHMVLDIPQAHITTESKISHIFDASTKRYTMFSNVSTNSPVLTPPTQATCKYLELSKLPSPAIVGKCVRDTAAMLKSTGSEEGLVKFEVNIPEASNASMAVDLYSDESHVLKKIITSTTLTGPHAMTQRMETVDMNAKAGAPDKDLFKVPPTWGTCEKAEAPSWHEAAPAADNTMALAFLVCMGMQDGQAALTV